MSKLKEIFLREMSPFRDLEGHDFQQDGTVKSAFNEISYFSKHIIKSACRGSFIGAAIGASAGLATGNPIKESAAFGVATIGYLDALQFGTHYLAKRMISKLNLE